MSDEVAGGTFVDAMHGERMTRLRQIEAALRAAGITDENAHEYKFIEEHQPGRSNRLLGVQDRAGAWVVRFEDAS